MITMVGLERDIGIGVIMEILGMILVQAALVTLEIMVVIVMPFIVAVRHLAGFYILESQHRNGDVD